MENRVAFDYAAMARAAARERDALQARIRLRKAQGPDSGHVAVWRQENAALYTMYLEQRRNARLFAYRDQQRRDGHGFQAWP